MISIRWSPTAILTLTLVSAAMENNLSSLRYGNILASMGVASETPAVSSAPGLFSTSCSSNDTCVVLRAGLNHGLNSQLGLLQWRLAQYAATHNDGKLVKSIRLAICVDPKLLARKMCRDCSCHLSASNLAAEYQMLCRYKVNMKSNCSSV